MASPKSRIDLLDQKRNQPVAQPQPYYPPRHEHPYLIGQLGCLIPVGLLIGGTILAIIANLPK